MKKRNLHANKVVITGAASGIGRGLAIAFAKEQCTILLADINEAGLKQTYEMVKQAGGNPEIFLCDVSKLDDVMRMSHHCFNAWGKVDILVNNAGVASVGIMGDIPIKDWEWIVSINLWGVVYGCHAFLPMMKKQGCGHVVNVASIAGIISSAEMSPYNATKAAIISVSETLKSELAPYNIGVTVVCPTFIKTNLMETIRFTDEFQRQCSVAGIVSAKWTPEMIADQIANAVKKNKLYVVPQLAARLIWIFKRISPSAFFGFFAFLMRKGWARKLMLSMARTGF
jgi:short-subunit dehydrogenase